MSLADLPPSDPKFTRLIHEMQPAFSQLLGSEVVYATKDMVVAELLIRPEHGNRNGVMHGGAIMAFADDLGGAATFINLPEGAGTTTVESKTNFFAAIPLGDTARGVCTPLHRGRSTMVWQTRVTRGDGKLAALITQTQMVLPGRGKTA
ncbi:MAG: PaaI family thioesterase [Variibacter sp.]